jgi:hypothetical protein
MPSLLITAIILLILGLIIFLVYVILVHGSVTQVDILTLRENIRSNCCSIYNCTASVSSVNCKVGNTTKSFQQWLNDIGNPSAQDFCYCRVD